MKNFKFYFLFLTLVFCFFALKVLATGENQFPDPTQLQPLPPDTYPNIPGNSNKEEAINLNNDVLLRQLSQYNFDRNQLDANNSYVDTINHRLFVADTNNNRVFVFNLNSDNILTDYNPDNVLGQPDFVTSTPGTSQSQLNGPNGIAYDSANSNLFVADTNNNRIMVFNVASITNGENAINVLGQPDFVTSTPGTSQSQLNGPFHLDYDSAHNILYVTDVNNNRVMVFNTNPIINGENAINVLGQPDFVTSTPGDSVAQLNTPDSVVYDRANNSVLVSDTKNNRILSFRTNPIVNGENAKEVLTQYDVVKRSPLLAPKVKIEPKNATENKNTPQQNKKISLASIFMWLVIVAMGVAVLFFYLRPREQ